MKASSLGIGLVLALVVTACGAETTGGGSAGPSGSGGSGGSGASAGSGGSGSAPGLAAQGTVTNECGPADGPAVDFRIGTPSSCPIAPSAVPFVHMYAYPGSTSGFAPGQAWSSDATSGSNKVDIEWFPEGSGNNHDPAQSGTLAIISVGTGSARVKYTFVTADGQTYTGEADVVVCPSSPMCG